MLSLTRWNPFEELDRPAPRDGPCFWTVVGRAPRPQGLVLGACYRGHLGKGRLESPDGAARH